MVEKGKVRVLFSDDPVSMDPNTGLSVVICPSRDKYNDFKFRTFADFSIYLNGNRYSYEGYVGFFDQPDDPDVNGINFLWNLLGSSESKVVDARDLKLFSMAQSIEVYREIVNFLGVEKTRDTLLAINDLVSIGEYDQSNKMVDKVREMEIFNMSFMRRAETFYAYKNAGTVLKGLEEEKIIEVSKDLIIDFKLSGYENRHKINFKFDDDGLLPKRTSIVIGKNGTGKSQTLSRIVRAAIKGDGTLVDGVTGERPTFNRLLAFSPTNEAGHVFPDGRLKNVTVWYKSFSLNRSRRSRRNEYLNDLIVQIARSEQVILSRKRWDIFCDVVEGIRAGRDLVIPTKDEFESWITLSDLPLSNEERVLKRSKAIDYKSEPRWLIEGECFPLSSGEISFVRFAAQACLHIDSGSLLLLDEPETHLHPNFISKFSALLNELLSKTGSIAIIATHSAYLVQEVFREQVNVLRAVDGRISIERPRLKTFGADVGEISYFVFGEDKISEVAEQVRSDIVSRFSSWQEVMEKYKNELSNEFLGQIRLEMEGKANHDDGGSYE
ncbi:AAA family ATPase [Marinobacter sp. PE14]